MRQPKRTRDCTDGLWMVTRDDFDGNSLGREIAERLGGVRTDFVLQDDECDRLDLSDGCEVFGIGQPLARPSRRTRLPLTTARVTCDLAMSATGLLA